MDNIKDLAEEWREIPGKEGCYSISNLGRVKSHARKVNTWNSYKSIPETIRKQRLRGEYLSTGRFPNTHRLVAIVFIPNPNNYPMVNHIDGNKLNNRVDNLEWCNNSQNVTHAWSTGLANDNTRKLMSEKAALRTGSKNSCWKGYVDILSLSNDFIIQVESLKEAVNYLKLNTIYTKAGKGSISRNCSGLITQTYGHKFKYNYERIN